MFRKDGTAVNGNPYSTTKKKLSQKRQTVQSVPCTSRLKRTFSNKRAPITPNYLNNQQKLRSPRKGAFLTRETENLFHNNTSIFEKYEKNHTIFLFINSVPYAIRKYKQCIFQEGQNMKTLKVIAGLIAVLALGLAGCSNPLTDADEPSLSVKSVDKGTTIQEGVLTYGIGHYLADEPLQVGFDPYGYNYQAHLFNGSYANVYLGGAGFPPYEGDDDAYLAENPGAETHWAWPYRNVRLAMKWNDAWLSNKDRDGDGLLDRHFGFGSYIGSGAWETNHQSGGETKDRWTYFVKIVAAPADDAYLDGGIWYTADGVEIGPVIWGAFAIIQQVESGLGAIYVSPAGPGFGRF